MLNSPQAQPPDNSAIVRSLVAKFNEGRPAFEALNAAHQNFEKADFPIEVDVPTSRHENRSPSLSGAAFMGPGGGSTFLTQRQKGHSGMPVEPQPGKPDAHYPNGSKRSPFSR